MALQQQPLHILFFPFLAPGHLLPMTDMAALFAARGVKCTILTTPDNALIIRSAIDRANDGFRDTDNILISLTLIPFPSAEVGLPQGIESYPKLVSDTDRAKFWKAIQLLRHPFNHAIVNLRPDAAVTDRLLALSADAAVENGVPRISFQGISLFARCAEESALLHNLMESSATNDPNEVVTIPGLPHRVELRRSQMVDPKERSDRSAFLKSLRESDAKSLGEVVNSFHELEPDYVEHYHRVLNRRSWMVGPVALRSNRGGQQSTADDECLRWLDTKQSGSVVYVCFGTVSHFSAAQLRELALGLDMSAKNFIWVVKDIPDGKSEWLPEAFEERMSEQSRGLIIKGWAPQLLILNHSAVGGFVTHCGWNSSLEAVSAGVPMITWPLCADQFYNEKLIVEVSGVGVGVGAKEFASNLGDRKVIEGEAIGRAIEKVMGDGEHAKAARNRAVELAEKARSAVAEGGSSHADLGRLIDELVARRSTKA